MEADRERFGDEFADDFGFDFGGIWGMKCQDKKKYDHRGAWHALHRIRMGGASGIQKLYRCHCDNYHLTKHPPATDLAAEWRKIVVAEEI